MWCCQEKLNSILVIFAKLFCAKSLLIVVWEEKHGSLPNQILRQISERESFIIHRQSEKHTAPLPP